MHRKRKALEVIRKQEMERVNALQKRLNGGNPSKLRKIDDIDAKISVKKEKD